MTGTIRTLLIDPREETRGELLGLLAGLGKLRLLEPCASYESAARALAERAPGVVVVVLDADPAEALGVLEAALKADPSAAVLPASRARDSDLILRAMRAGAREFLTLPAGLSELEGAIERLLPKGGPATPAAGKGAQILAIAGATGGVGCTTLAVNLATALARREGHSAVLADFDLLNGSVDASLDLVPDHTLLDVSQNIERLDQTLLTRSLTRHASGLLILPPPAALQDVARIEPEALRRVLDMLKAGFDSVVIDTSKGLQASDFVAFEEATAILLIVQLDLICLRNSARLLDLFRQYEGLIDKVRVVVNRLGSSDSEVGIKKAEQALGRPIAFRVPNAFKVFDAARSRGVTLEEEAAGCRAHKALQEMAQAFLPPPAEPARPRRGRFAAFF